MKDNIFDIFCPFCGAELEETLIPQANEFEKLKAEVESLKARHDAYQEEAHVARELLRVVSKYLAEETNIPASPLWKTYLEARAKTKKLES